MIHNLIKCWCYAFHLSPNIGKSHKSRFNLFGLINQQCITYMSVAEIKRMTTRLVAKRLTYRITQVDNITMTCKINRLP